MSSFEEQNITGNSEKLLDLLMNLYWETVSREVRAMIVSFHFFTESPQFRDFKWAKNEAVPHYFRSLFSTWSISSNSLYIAKLVLIVGRTTSWQSGTLHRSCRM
jgi:hypothetical protein